jgi:archaellin
MEKIAGDDAAFTRLEAAIIIIAIVVVAALFAYYLAKAGIFNV